MQKQDYRHRYKGKGCTMFLGVVLHFWCFVGTGRVGLACVSQQRMILTRSRCLQL